MHEKNGSPTWIQQCASGKLNGLSTVALAQSLVQQLILFFPVYYNAQIMVAQKLAKTETQAGIQ